MNVTSHTPAKARTPRGHSRPASLPVLALLLAVFAMVVTACSVDLETTQTIDKKGAGNRTMKVVIDIDDDKVRSKTKSAESVKKALEKHAPKGTSIEKVTKSKKEYVITAVIKFKDQKEYKKAVQAAVEAGDGDPNQVDIDYEVLDTPLRQGVELKESTSTKEILEWMGEALVEEKQFSKSDLEDTSVHQNQASLNLAGEKFKNRSAPFDVSQGDDYGFSTIRVGIQPRSKGYRLAVEYGLGQEGSDYAKERGKFLNDVLPDGAERKGADDGNGSALTDSVVMDVQDDQALNEALVKLTGDKKANFSTTIDSVPNKPLQKQLKAAAKIDCTDICKDGRQSGLQVFYLPDSAWTSGESASEGVIPDAWGIDSEKTGVIRLKGESGDYAGDQTRTIPVTKVDSKLKVGASESMDFETSIAVPAAQIGDSSKEIEKALKPKDGDVTAEKSGKNQVYTLKISGDDAQDLTKKVSKTLPAFNIEQKDMGGLWPEHQLRINYDPSAGFDSSVSGGSNLEVKLPFMHSFKDGDKGDVKLNNNAASVSYAGPSVGWYVLMGVLALLIVGAVIVIFVFRTKLAGWSASRKEKAAQMNKERASQAQQYQAQQYEAQQYNAYNQGATSYAGTDDAPPAPGPDAPPPPQEPTDPENPKDQ